MINFDSLTLKLFSDENNDFFVGAKIQKIQQPNRNELVFSIRNNGETKKLYINFNPSFYHICFMSAENELKRNILYPKAAPMFCMLLRKYIQNSKIIKVVVPKYERIFELYFEYYDELNEKIQLCLAVELMGKYSNVILYNYDTNVIIGCAHNVSSEKSRERELYGMLPYVYPPKQHKKDLMKTSFNEFKEDIDISNIAKSISNKYYYLTFSFVEDIISQTVPFSYENLYQKLKDCLLLNNYTPCILNDYSKFYIVEFPDCFKYKNINEMIDNYFSFHQSNSSIKNLKSKILKQINFQLKKLYSIQEKQNIQIKKIDNASEYKNYGDIIMSNLYSLNKGLKEADLYDFNGNLIKINLDEDITPIENANKYYLIYKKIKTAYEYAQNMIKETNSQILYYEELKFYTEKTNDYIELDDIYSELNNCSKSEKEKKVQNIESINFKNVKIYIGKNKKQNDYILSKLSSPEDIWFHPLNTAGAHVLVKVNNTKDIINDEIILKAAQITKEYSSQENNSKTSIIYTKRKYVKKANNKLAFVTYKNETEIIV